MENKIIFSDKEESKQNELSTQSHQDESQFLNLFCNDCFQIPEYKIEIEKNKTIFLSHQCNDVENKKLFQTNIKYLLFSENKCCYCQKTCTSICIECKNHICQNCENGHIPKEEDEISNLLFSQNEDKDNEEKKYIYPSNDIQFICKVHFLQFAFFCPFCRINLCIHCKNYHHHINCLSLIDYKVKNNTKSINYEGSDDIIEKLKKLSEIFEECYSSSIKNGKITINILLNYSLIDGINIFIGNYLKDFKTKSSKKKRFISRTILNNLKESDYLCKQFGDDEFFEKYSNLIKNVNNGDYEYHFKLEVLKDFYKRKNRYEKKSNRFNDSEFYTSLKGTIDYFRNQYHYANETITIINSNINSNYLNKKIENLKLVLRIYDSDINLLKKINLKLLYKYNFQSRRKIGNLILQLLIYNYWHLLDPIKETDYILFESQLLLKKKISQVQNLSGPDDIKKEYEKKLMHHYSNLLQKTSTKILEEHKNAILENPEKNFFEDEEANLQFHQLTNDSNHIQEAVIINIFYKLRKFFGYIFNESIHNKTEQINAQIKEEIEKLNNFNIKGNKNEIKEKENKENENINIINEIKDNKCISFFKGINEIKNIFNIDANAIKNKYANILKIFDNPRKNIYTESNINEFKKELENLFKNYELEDTQEIEKVLNLYFNGEILDVLMEKRTFQNITILQNEKETVDLENEKNDVFKGLNQVETLIDELLENIESIMIRAHMYIKQFERLFDKGINNNIKIQKNNPILFLDKCRRVMLNNIRDPDRIQNLYMNYLINFYFFAQDMCEYLKKLKKSYKEIELIKAIENNFEKRKILEIFNSGVKYEEHSDLKYEWNKLKNEEVFIEGNPFLNDRIKKYINSNDENQFLDDLKNLEKIRSKKINLSLADPQKIIIKAYFLQNGIPLEIPKGLSLKSENK